MTAAAGYADPMLLLVLLGCTADPPKSSPADSGSTSLVGSTLVLNLDPERRFLAIPASTLPPFVELDVDGADPGSVRFRLETATGALISNDTGPGLAPVPNQRVEITVGDITWALSLVPDDLPVVSGPGGDVDGFFFLTPRERGAPYPPSGYGKYLLVVDGAGVPVWWRDTTGLSNDFRVGGDGLFSAQTFLDGAPKRESVRIDPVGGAAVERWVPTAPDGWEDAWTDPHELQVNADGTVLTVITGTDTVDLRSVGGDEVGEVQQSAVQLLAADRSVIAQWEAEIVDMTTLPPDAIATESERAPWRWTHINSAEAVEDGWLLSLRTPGEVVKVRRDTGEVEWRFGGIHSDFTLTNDGGFFGQHSVRWLGDDRLMLFDNRTNFGSPTLGDARYVEYALDLDAMMATLVDSFELQGAGGVDYTGHVQRLADGRTVVGWGSVQELDDGSRAPSIHVLEPDGSVSLELALPLGMYSYRAWYAEGDPIEGSWWRSEPPPR
ncbi:MAG: hypothetical protein ACI8PZ_000558 [Myxococcota bacterium]|jgi:hypothetical protein